MLGGIRISSLLLLGLIAPVFYKPVIAEEKKPKLEFFAIAGTGLLKSGLVSTEFGVDFGQISSGGGANFGGSIGFRPHSRLGIEFEGLGIMKHSLSAREDIGEDELKIERDYTGYNISINALVHLYRFNKAHNWSFEPYVVGGVGVFHLESTTTETLLAPWTGYG